MNRRGLFKLFVGAIAATALELDMLPKPKWTLSRAEFNALVYRTFSVRCDNAFFAGYINLLEFPHDNPTTPPIPS